MTKDELPNQEEITCLSEIRAGYSCFDEKEEPFYRALSKGIEALRKYLPDSVSKDDVIYRQAAENAIYHHFPKLSMDEARMILHEVPSAQPERSLWFRIGEICVDESKGSISAGRAVEKIRGLLREAERR